MRPCSTGDCLSQGKQLLCYIGLYKGNVGFIGVIIGRMEKKVETSIEGFFIWQTEKLLQHGKCGFRRLRTYLPVGSKDPNSRALGPKYYNIHGIWALQPYYLGFWSLRAPVRCEEQSCSFVKKRVFIV